MAAPTSDSAAVPPKPKVVYVLGAGRSGSTILGVALGNCDGVFFAGELYKWLPRAGAPKLEDAPRVAFWRSVRERFAPPSDANLASQAHRYLERSSALLHPVRRRAAGAGREPYRQLTGELFRAVAASAGAEYVVDTSHYPLRARELQSIDGIELYLVLLVRDPQDVVASFAREDVIERRFGPLTTRAYLLLTYALSAYVFLCQPRERRLALAYEDLLEDPSGVVRALLEEIGSDAPLPDFGSLQTGVPLHGNRLLADEVVALQSRRASLRESGERGGLGGRVFARLLLGALALLRPRLSASARAPSARRGPRASA